MSKGEVQTRRGSQSSALEVLITAGWNEDDQCFYAWSPQLGCMRDGETEDEAVAMCLEAIEILVEGLVERGTLAGFLREHGYLLTQPLTGPALPVLQDGFVFRQGLGTKEAKPTAVSGIAKATISASLEAKVG